MNQLIVYKSTLDDLISDAAGPIYICSTRESMDLVTYWYLTLSAFNSIGIPIQLKVQIARSGIGSISEEKSLVSRSVLVEQKVTSIIKEKTGLKPLNGIFGTPEPMLGTLTDEEMGKNVIDQLEQ